MMDESLTNENVMAAAVLVERAKREIVRRLTEKGYPKAWASVSDEHAAYGAGDSSDGSGLLCRLVKSYAEALAAIDALPIVGPMPLDLLAATLGIEQSATDKAAAS